ncbi:hypothetical protein A3B35_01545 [Candidatus Kaiserbacteria bacterium RIFCSPLOWO2_01_FULL_54_24]|uniref:Uncharacterized protein n=1 Tax=Candidatus Kaiserbacteria bacterium RIFCSPLOWO2_01_FULL_54_24 TaxID=1798515 RepID=A0A1F6ETW5_9BACT|nr:MAG: hypothetical protein A3B35_01545 [Candidatus Kaiserbacteria bacterium RIFCSPLOWO2_01_FULL_54_24]
MRHIGTHLKHTLAKTRITERGELMRYFCEKLNKSRIGDGLPPIGMGRMGKMLEQIPTKDLYYIKKVCDDSQNFSKKFWYLLNPEKYEKDNKKKFGKDNNMQ